MTIFGQVELLALVVPAQRYIMISILKRDMQMLYIFFSLPSLSISLFIYVSFFLFFLLAGIRKGHLWDWGYDVLSQL